jgi:hypothetical protein
MKPVIHLIDATHERTPDEVREIFLAVLARHRASVVYHPVSFEYEARTGWRTDAANAEPAGMRIEFPDGTEVDWYGSHPRLVLPQRGGIAILRRSGRQSTAFDFLYTLAARTNWFITDGGGVVARTREGEGAAIRLDPFPVTVTIAGAGELELLLAPARVARDVVEEHGHGRIATVRIAEPGGRRSSASI